MTRILAPLAALLLAACSTGLPRIGVPGLTSYQLEIPQGNIVTDAQIAAIRTGMTRAQVAGILGSPLLADPFHANRWDYIHQQRQDGRAITQSHYVLHFDGDVLARIETGRPVTAPTP